MQPSTDRDKLSSGFNKMMLSLPFFFAGPALIYYGAGHDHPIVFLMPGVFFCILAIFFAFTGLMGIMDSMFKSNKKR